MAYCTAEDVARYVTPAPTADIESAIAVATDRVHLYTGERFSTTTVPVSVTTNRSGIAYLPYSARTVTAVSLADTGEVLTADLYTFEAGRLAKLRIPKTLPYSILIKGREPWADQPTNSNLRLTVTGTFGYVATPSAVKEATAILAAQFLTETGQGTPTTAGSGTASDHAGIQSITVEGYSVTYQATADTDDTATGSAIVDRMLAPYRRSRGGWA